jgi:hypothetical protein
MWIHGDFLCMQQPAPVITVAIGEESGTPDTNGSFPIISAVHRHNPLLLCFFQGHFDHLYRNPNFPDIFCAHYNTK